MAEDGIVGQYNGSQARDVLVSLEDWESRHNQSGDAAATSTASGATAGGSTAKPRPIIPPTELLNASANPRRKNKIIPEPDEPSEIDDEEEEEVDEAEADDEEGYDQGEWEDEEPSDDAEERASDDEWEEEDEAEDADEDADDESEEVDEEEEEEVIETSPPRAKRR